MNYLERFQDSTSFTLFLALVIWSDPIYGLPPRGCVPAEKWPAGTYTAYAYPKAPEEQPVGWCIPCSEGMFNLLFE